MRLALWERPFCNDDCLRLEQGGEWMIPAENRLDDVLSLAGDWQATVGEQSGNATVPGVWELQGFPADAERAVYRREFEIPAGWVDSRIVLRFGAVSYDVEALVNGRRVGRHEGLWTPFEFDITDAARPGETNALELRIIKPLGEGDTYPYREALVGFLPYVAITFGGPWQPVELVTRRGPALRVQRLHADWRTGEVSLAVEVVDAGGDGIAGLRLTAEILDADGASIAHVTLDAAERLEFTLRVEDAALWSPDAPALHRLRLSLADASGVRAETERRFGFRGLHTEGDLLLLNGRPVNLRGVLSWGWDPATLAPTPTDAEIRDEFRRVRALGFNLVKLCLFVPPERVFEIADEEGMLLWLELPLWWQRMTDRLREQARVEYADILQRVHHHPSVVIYSLGCELGSDMADARLLSTLDALARETVGGALVCDNSGSGEAYAGLTFDYADFNDYHFYCDLQYFTPLLDHFRRDWRPSRPWIFGEYCDCDTYRDPAALLENGRRPWWREVLGVEGAPERWSYRDQETLMAAHNLPFSDAQLVDISYRQAFDFRKLVVERTRLRGDVGGYVITGLRDTPISTSGVFDDYNRPKFDAGAFRRFNANNVLLLDQGRRRDWVHGGDRPAPVDLFNHAGGDHVSLRIILNHIGLPETTALLKWRLLRPDGAVAMIGAVEVDALPPGRPREIAALELELPMVERAGKWTLEATLGDHAANAWALWLYPPTEIAPDDVAAVDPYGLFDGLWSQTTWAEAGQRIVLTPQLTSEARAFVEAGGRLILLDPRGGGLPVEPLPFWRESIRLLYTHPVFEHFPHEGHAGLQFYHLATDHAFTPAAFDDMDVRPVMQRLDARVFTVRDYLIDARLGVGRMLASTLRFFGGAGDQVRGLQASPAARFLLARMIDTLRHDRQ